MSEEIDIIAERPGEFETLEAYLDQALNTDKQVKEDPSGLRDDRIPLYMFEGGVAALREYGSKVEAYRLENVDVNQVYSALLSEDPDYVGTRGDDWEELARDVLRELKPQFQE